MSESSPVSDLVLCLPTTAVVSSCPAAPSGRSLVLTPHLGIKLLVELSKVWEVLTSRYDCVLPRASPGRGARSPSGPYPEPCLQLLVFHSVCLPGPSFSSLTDTTRKGMPTHLLHSDSFLMCFSHKVFCGLRAFWAS